MADQNGQGRFSGTVSDFNPAALIDRERYGPAGLERVHSEAISTTPAESDFLALEVGPFTGRATEVRDGAIQGVLNPYLNADRDADYPGLGLQAGFYGSSAGPDMSGDGDDYGRRFPRRA